ISRAGDLVLRAVSVRYPVVAARSVAWTRRRSTRTDDAAPCDRQLGSMVARHSLTMSRPNEQNARDPDCRRYPRGVLLQESRPRSRTCNAVPFDEALCARSRAPRPGALEPQGPQGQPSRLIGGASDQPTPARTATAPR